MKQSYVKMVLTLTFVAFASSSLLSLSYLATYKKIEEEERKVFLSYLNSVLPDHDNEPDVDAVYVEDRYIYPATSGEEVVAFAITSKSPKGYSGDINVLVGIDLYGRVTGVEIVKHLETPGLGDKIDSAEFKNSFRGLRLDDNIAVKKDGGIIDEFSGATISPRAVSEAVRDAIIFFDDYVEEIL